jgi:Tfp pilus assembly protein PilF
VEYSPVAVDFSTLANDPGGGLLFPSMADPRRKGGEKKRDRARETGARPAGLLASPWKLAVAVFVVAFALYANTLGHEFLWDDRDLIVDNAAVQTLDGPTLRAIFLENFWRNVVRTGGYYRPMVTLSYHVDYRLHGADAGGFHLTNVVCHALVCTLVFLFVYVLFDHAVFALLTAVLFAAHPLHTENVAWVSGRTDLLASLWMLASLVLYVLSKRRGARFLPFALAAFMLALLSKESAACLPLVIGLLEFGPFGELLSARRRSAAAAPAEPRAARNVPRSVVITACFFAVLVLYLLLRRHVIGTSLSTYPPYAPGAGRLAVPLSIVAGYALKLVWPFRPNAEYDAHVSRGLDAHALAGMAVLALIAYAAWRYRRRPDLILGLGVLVLGLGPVLNIIPIGEVSAERFLYFPSLGFVLVIASLFTDALAQKARSVGRIAGGARSPVPASLAGTVTWLLAATLTAYTVRTVSRSSDWANENVLFAKTVQSAPNSARAHLGVAGAAERRGDLTAAVAAYQRALAIDPDYPDALSNLAGIYARQGRIDEAAEMLQRALRAAPGNLRLQTNLGALYYQKRQFDEAARQFERVIAADPNQGDALFNLALIRLQQGRPAEASAHFQAVAGKGERFNLAFYYLALIERDAGNEERARQLAQHFLSVSRPNDPFRARAQAIVSGKAPAGP